MFRRKCNLAMILSSSHCRARNQFKSVKVRHFALNTLLVLFSLVSTSYAQERISDCGFLQNGVEAGCIIFVSDHYGHFLVGGDISPFSVGDRVYVEGSVESCITTCMQGPCLYVDSVGTCGGSNSNCRQTFVITSTVVDSVSGQPVDSAMVCIEIDCDPHCLIEPWLCGFCDETDSLGRFEVTRTCSVPQGEYFVGTYCLNVHAPGYTSKRECKNVFIFAPCFGGNDLDLHLVIGAVLLKPITTGIEEIENSELPKHFELHQNYPNPFNPETRIEFSLPRRSFVTIKVYNIVGRRIRNLVNEELSAGHKVVTWDGRDDNEAVVSSGIYIYRIIADEFVQSKKMLLLK